MNNGEMIEGMNLPEDLKKAIIDCPNEIIDLDKFITHFELEKEAQKLETYKSSDGVVLNMKKPMKHLKTDVEHLPQNEQEIIFNTRNKYSSLIIKSKNFFRASVGAYGNEANKTTLTPTHNKLFLDKKAELLDLFGRFFSIDEIISISKKDWGKSQYTKEVLASFYKENFDEINAQREKHKQDFNHLRLSHKTSRLEELTWMYNKMKLKYERSASREDHRVLLQTIDSIRKEIEGDRLTIEGNIDLTIQEEVNSQIRNEILRGLPLREIIIGRLAARLNTSPRELVKDMCSSYYARFNRLLGGVEEATIQETSYPSEQEYDFEFIKNVNDEREKVEKKQLIESQTKSEETIVSDNSKNLLLERLKQNANNLKSKQNDIKRRFE